MDNDNKNLNYEESFFTDDIVKGLLIVVGFIGIFVLGFNLFGSKDAPEAEPSDTTAVVQQTVADTQITTVPSTVAPTAAPDTATTAPSVSGDTVRQMLWGI